MSETLWTVMESVSGLVVILLTLPGACELLLVTWGGLLWRFRAPRASDGSPSRETPPLRLAVVVPAHNEEVLIQRCVQSLLACEKADPSGIVVVADNCTDATAERARAAGARVLIRQDLQQRGKGCALAFAFEQLLTEPWDAYAVVDADTVVETNFLVECRRLLAEGADAVQVRYLVHNATDSSRTRLMRVALLAFNVLRPRGRDYWGYSAGILGNGFVLTKETLLAVPYTVRSVVEDLEYHLRLVRAGRKVRFVDATTVWAEMPARGAGMVTQRTRWEGGRLRVLRDMALPLGREILQGRWRLVEPLLELLLLPLAFHAALLLAALITPIAALQAYALIGLSLVSGHVLVALATCGGTWSDAAALVTAPVYLLWKLTLIPALLRTARPDAAWVRTPRTAPPLSSPKSDEALDASIVVVSFNTRELLRECLLTVQREAVGVSYEVIVVDNASNDGSPEMVASSFPWVRLIRSQENLGFAAANNCAFAAAQGRYLVLLNSDAFPRPGALRRAVTHMDAAPHVGLAGARLVGRDDSWQPSARLFPSPLNDFLALSGLAAKFPRSRFFGRVDRTWADPLQPAAVEWTPGAFAIIRRAVLEQVGHFDERFFLYYEEVDLCRRIRAAGHKVWYWPDVVVVHLGGESSKTVKHLTLASSGSQLMLWRMRSALLYYYKHHGVCCAWLARSLETVWHAVRALRHVHSRDPERQAKAEESRAIAILMRKAWQETHGGRVAPERPW